MRSQALNLGAQFQVTYVGKTVIQNFGSIQTFLRAGNQSKGIKLGIKVLIIDVTKNPKVSPAELQRSCMQMVESSRRSAIAAARHRSELCDRVSRRKPVLRGRHLKARVGGQHSWWLINSRWSADISLVELWQKWPKQMEMTKLQIKP